MAKAARVIGDTVLATGRFDLTRTEIEVREDDGSTRTLEHEWCMHRVLWVPDNRGRS